MSDQRMLKDIPIIGYPLPLILLTITACGLLIGSANGMSTGSSNNNNKSIRKHPGFFSKYKLCSMIGASNSELRQLKRDFMEQITNIYMKAKSDPFIGSEVAGKGGIVATATTIMAVEFADIVVKKHIIQRRLLAGLKVAYVKFLPVNTLKKLVERYDSYSWLEGQSQVDLRPRFPNARENQYVQLYSLIALRARVRAADDILTLTTDNIKRILKTVEWFLIERRLGPGDSSVELGIMSQYAIKIMSFYLEHVINNQQMIQETYEKYLEQTTMLAESIGGEGEFLKFIDKIIDVEALDIDLNQDAKSLDLPPTINEAIINNVERKWIPKKVLEYINEDRSILVKNSDNIKDLIRLEPENNVDLASWCTNALMYVRQHSY